MAAAQFFHRLFNRKNRDPESPRPSSLSIPDRAPTPAPASASINSIPNWSRAVLESVGVDNATCRVNGCPTDSKHLPTLPPDYCSVLSILSDNRHHNSSSPVEIHLQSQSSFFSRLPPEVRNLIYLFAFGNRRIHLDFDFNPQQGQWKWWHRVCDDAENCLDKTFQCPEYAGAEEAMLKLASRSWVKEGFEYKLDAVNWLKCCRRAYLETLPVLYTSNTFVFTHGIDQLFRLSCVMPRDHLALIVSLSVEIDIYRIIKRPPHIDPWFKSFYGKVFRILLCELKNAKDLRFSIAGLCHHSGNPMQWVGHEECDWIAPWEELASSRSWKRLDIAVPRGWVPEFEGVVQRNSAVEEQRRYRLVAGSHDCPRGW
ncbi:hypothetical protein BDV32DRAFT_160900 [Aspergillus pseudonomiae]|uniref:DUF7730 domain-containing protein n=1 Tax=Aspergillus pseudonomiae TaxID=1506151 RepID=A0A5N6HR26_9EURO|nr:uncharacterized protein BDV37DRAFT_282314 [Aspergillus pseudonomiae]KAB8256825.1 hypothetical protein BDV32DRAFT_160900 [Aspergillus pseudonomiae]KAE8405078.1 hypothetical protein BDV37DRAFT_282314 [Aspergillus pseudonomiae]